MKLWYAVGATLMAGFAGFFVGTVTPLHPLNQDLKKIGWFLFGASLLMVVAFMGAGVRGQ